MNFSATVVSVTPKPEFREIEAASGDATPVETRSVVYPDGRKETPIFRREQLKCGHRIAGPAVIEEAASVTVLNQGHTVEVDRYGNLLIGSA